MIHKKMAWREFPVGIAGSILTCDTPVGVVIFSFSIVCGTDSVFSRYGEIVQTKMEDSSNFISTEKGGRSLLV